MPTAMEISKMPKPAIDRVTMPKIPKHPPAQEPDPRAETEQTLQRIRQHVETADHGLTRPSGPMKPVNASLPKIPAPASEPQSSTLSATGQALRVNPQAKSIGKERGKIGAATALRIALQDLPTNAPAMSIDKVQQSVSLPSRLVLRMSGQTVDALAREEAPGVEFIDIPINATFACRMTRPALELVRAWLTGIESWHQGNTRRNLSAVIAQGRLTYAERESRSYGDEGTAAAVQRQWMESLELYPLWTVSKAFQQWVATSRHPPQIANIRELCDRLWPWAALVTRAQFLIDAAKREGFIDG